MTEAARAPLADRGPARGEVAQAWNELALAQGFKAQSFWTLTFDEKRIGKVSREKAWNAWRWIVRSINVLQHGRQFRSWCKHSAFSYMAAVDYSELGAVHLHAIVDGWVDFHLVHQLWNMRYGFAWMSLVDGDEENRVALAHLIKYETKSTGEVLWWFRNQEPNRLAPTVGDLPAARPGGPSQAQPTLPGILAGSAQRPGQAGRARRA